MIWLVLRRQRTALLIGAGLVVVLAVVVAITRVRYLADVQASGLQGCLTPERSACPDPAWNDLVGRYVAYWGLIHVALISTPSLLGILAGAGLFGRERDQGTDVFALTQSIGRLRWWLTGLLVAGIPAAGVAGLLTLFTGWMLAPLNLTGAPLDSPRFDVSGIVPVVQALLAFAVAATVGLLLRSTLAAVVATVVVQFVVLFTLATQVRPHYMPPEASVAPLASAEDLDRIDVPDGAWLLHIEQIDAAGRVIPSARTAASCAVAAEQSYVACLQAAGIVANRDLYQSADRYWPFQLIESGILALLAAAALGLGLVGLRRRAP